MLKRIKLTWFDRLLGSKIYCSRCGQQLYEVGYDMGAGFTCPDIKHCCERVHAAKLKKEELDEALVQIENNARKRNEGK